MGVKNGLWNKKKREKCEGREFCEGNEGDTWEGKSGIEEITRRNEKYVNRNRNRKEAVEYKVRDKVLLSMKDLMW